MVNLPHASPDCVADHGTRSVPAALFVVVPDELFELAGLSDPKKEARMTTPIHRYRCTLSALAEAIARSPIRVPAPLSFACSFVRGRSALPGPALPAGFDAVDVAILSWIAKEAWRGSPRSYWV